MRSLLFRHFQSHYRGRVFVSLLHGALHVYIEDLRLLSSDGIGDLVHALHVVELDANGYITQLSFVGELDAMIIRMMANITHS